MHIFRAARIRAELRKQTGSGVPKARNLNDSASVDNMVTGNLIPQTKPDIGDCVCLLLLTGLGVGLGPPRRTSLGTCRVTTV